MRNLKKFLALVLAFVMAMSLMVTVNAAPAKPEDFGDVSAGSSSYAEAINVLSALGVINGYETDDGTIFNPKGEIKRSEVAAILYRIANNDAAEEQVGIYKDYNRFSDVPSDAWYAGAVNYCANSELVVGVGDDRYAPHSKVTGYQVLAMALRMLGYDQNGEFEGSGWQIRTASYARTVGLTDNIKEGTLGANATREMVAEIMFQALQAPTVSYNLLRNYYPNNVLIADNDDNRDAYANAIAANKLTLPLNGNLMYANYGIVGKTTGEADPFGRPTEAWVKDHKDDVSVGTGSDGNAGKYIVNSFVNPKSPAPATDTGAGVEDEVLSIAVTPVAVYTDAIDECHLTKEINKDNSIYWGAITEIVNGEALAARTAVKLDALHTSTQFIGATGRTTEIYKVGKVTVNKNTGVINAGVAAPATDVVVDHWIFVYIDTFLGEVDSVIEEVKDSAGHTIIEPQAIVLVGNKIADADGTAKNTVGPVKITVNNPGGKYAEGDLVLLQTPNGGKWTTAAAKKTGNDVAAGTGFVKGTNGPDPVTNPELAPLCPIDVPNEFEHFAAGTDAATKPILLPVGAKTVKNVTIKATVGAQDSKMGIISADGTTYMASNTFLAARQTLTGSDTKINNTVLAKWYDVPNGDQTNDNAVGKTPNRGIVNGMIGKTYDIVLDQNDHIIGMKEVLAVTSNVGVITGLDAKRVGTGKYVTQVDAYMSDGTNASFDVVSMPAAQVTNIATNTVDTSTFTLFKGASAVDDAWASGGAYAKLGVGSLVMFKQCTVDGVNAWYIADMDTVAGTVMTDKGHPAATNQDGTIGVQGQAESGEAVENLAATDGKVGNSLGQVKTGVTGTLQAGELNNSKLDDESVIFVAEYEYRYDTTGNNDGSNINKTYKVYEGFKKMPTITGLDNGASNILFQQLKNNPEYVLIYAKNSEKEYTIKNQEKITVDDSYLVLSRGATYATYSEYNVLKNGEKTTLQVSNANAMVNAAIEATMKGGADENELLVVTGRNAAGYVTSVSTVSNLASATPADTNALLNTGKLAGHEVIAKAATPNGATPDISYKNGVLKTIATNNQYLTLDDNVKVQLVNRDQKTVTEISLDVAMVYANNTGLKLNDAKPMVFELNELGYVCNLYVIE